MLVQALYTMVLFEQLLPDLCYCFNNLESTVVWSWKIMSITCINLIFTAITSVGSTCIQIQYMSRDYASSFNPFVYTENLITRECIYTENEIDIIIICSQLVFMMSSYSWLLMLVWDPAVRAGFSSMAWGQGDIIPCRFYCGFHNTLQVLLWISALNTEVLLVLTCECVSHTDSRSL